MKAIALACALLSLSAFAANKNSSWEEIRNDWDLETREGQINFGGSFVSLFDVCQSSETQLRTKTPINVYEWVSDEDYEVVGKAYKFKNIKHKRVVVDGDSTAWEDAEYSLNYMISVYTADDEGWGRFQFKKAYTIPVCE